MSCNSCDNLTEFSNKDPAETVILTFNYQPALSPSEYLVSVNTPTVTVIAGEDPNPQDLIAGLVALGVTGFTAQVPVHGGLLGVSYRISVLVSTSEQQELICAGTLTIEQA
jgi:hypothetical protein